MTHDPDELTPVERERLRSLAATPEPPFDLEARTVLTLRDQGAFAPARPSGVPARLAALARLAAVLLLGVWIGQALGAGVVPAEPPEPVGDDGTQFLLLVRSTQTQRDQLSPEQVAQRVEEYGAWAASLGPALVDAAKLDVRTDELRLVDGALRVDPRQPPGTLDDPVGGYFLIQVEDRERALELAATCPHLAHGGWLELRALEP